MFSTAGITELPWSPYGTLPLQYLQAKHEAFTCTHKAVSAGLATSITMLLESLETRLIIRTSARQGESNPRHIAHQGMTATFFAKDNPIQPSLVRVDPNTA